MKSKPEKDKEDSDSKKEDKSKEKKEPVKKVPLTQLFRYCTCGELLILLVGCLVALATGSGLPLMSILTGQVSGQFVDEQMYKNGVWNMTHPNSTYDENHFKNEVMKIVYLYGGMAITMFVSASIQVSCFLYVCEQMNNRLRRIFVRAVLRQDIPWFDQNSSGALAPKLFDNLERVREGTGDKIGLMLQAFSQFITGFAVAFAHSWKLTLVMMALTPLQALCGMAIHRSVTTFTMAEAKKYSVAGKIVEEAVSSIKTVVALNALPFEIKRYKAAILEARKSGILKNLFFGIAFGLMGFTNFFSSALSFYIGIGWVHDGSMTMESLITTFFSVLMGSMALGQAGPQVGVLAAAQGAAASIFEVLDRTPIIDSSSPEGIRGKPLKGNIRISNIHFNYPTRPDVKILNGLSLDINAGETVALVGSSGCGKSTIINLLLRYYDVDSGKITIDGYPISELNIEYLRSQIAVVSQEPVLFNCSVEENIQGYRGNISHNDVVNACKMSNAHNFIHDLTQGYQTMVGDRGTQLSGGQKQRIAIARAMVRDPKILLLDEATSALDAESEAVVQEALNKASKGRTTIIIAHRLSTIKHADKIIAMKGGELAEMGTHDELMAKKGLYHDLVTAQTFSDAVDGFDGSAAAIVPSYERAESVQKVFKRAVSKFSTNSEASNRIRSMTMDSLTNDTPALVEVKEEKKDDLTRLKKELKAEGLKSSSFLTIMAQAKAQWIFLFIGLSVSLIGGCVFPAYSVIFTQVVQTFTDPSTLLSKGHFWSLMFLALAGVQGLSFFSECFFMGLASEYLCADLRDRLFTNVLSQDMAYFDSPKHACGKICTRLASDVPNLKNALDFRLAMVLATFVSLGCGIGLAFYYGWRLAFLVVAILPLLAIGHSLRMRIVSGKHNKTAKDFESSGKIAIEAIENVKTVQALTRENEYHEQYCHHLDGPHRSALREVFVQGLSYGVASCVVYILNCSAYRLGLYLILQNTMEPIPVLRVINAISMSATTIGFAISYFPEYMKAKFAGGIIFSMLQESASMNNLTKDGKKETLTGTVTFKNVSFAYPERPQSQILRNLSFTVKPGQTLALVGPSGCGKSTTVALIERFYDVKGGQVLLDSHDIRTLNPHHTRAQIAIVSQEPILFDCSIKENITYGMDGEIDMNKVESATRKANIHEFIASLPDGYDTRVGDKGTQLSGGQKQRIAIARALIRDPKILLLDEATSALDTESEKVVQEALDRAREGRTCIVIAHRLSTVVNADSIAVVKGGEIVEQGSHSELLHKKGAYYELTQRQTMKT